jgi:hypothetical protein
LIHADPERQVAPERLQVARELGHLPWLLDVAGKQDHAAETELACQRSQLGGNRCTGKAAYQKLTDGTAKRGGHEFIIGQSDVRLLVFGFGLSAVGLDLTFDL